MIEYGGVNLKINKVSGLLLAGAMFLSSASIALANVNDTNLNYMSTLQNKISNDYKVNFYFEGKEFMHIVYLNATENGLIGMSLAGAVDNNTIYEGMIINDLLIFNETGQLVAFSKSDSLSSNIINSVQNIIEVNPSSQEYIALSLMTIINPTASAVNHSTMRSHFINHNNEKQAYEDTSSQLTLMNFEEALKNNGMIKAKNTAGISGYVYAREIVRDHNHIINDVKFINLYDADAITVIGEFQIG